MKRWLTANPHAPVDLRGEFLGGATTFMTLSYILFVQPALLSICGMDPGSVLTATCMASALATGIMAFFAKYPIAVAPAMGHNFFFVFTVCGALSAGGFGWTWQRALGAVFISGSIFLVFSFVGLRERVLAAVPETLRHSIAAGIGLMIAWAGLRWSGMIELTADGSVRGVADLRNRAFAVTATGLLIIGIFMARRMRGAILIGMIVAAVLGNLLGVVRFHGIVSMPPSISPTFLKLDIAGVFKEPNVLTVIFVFFFLDLFDTVGTLVGVSDRAGFLKNGKLPRASQALFSDAAGTVTGAALGTSTLTSYVESASGISAGARTGIANLVTAFLFLAALFFSPLVETIGGGYESAPGVILYPAVSPALIAVGVLMMASVRKIDWDEPVKAIPAFLTMMAMIPGTSISDGIAFGFISYSVLSLASGRGRKAGLLLHFIALLLLLRYLLAG